MSDSNILNACALGEPKPEFKYVAPKSACVPLLPFEFVKIFEPLKALYMMKNEPFTDNVPKSAVAMVNS